MANVQYAIFIEKPLFACWYSILLWQRETHREIERQRESVVPSSGLIEHGNLVPCCMTHTYTRCDFVMSQATTTLQTTKTPPHYTTQPHTICGHQSKAKAKVELYHPPFALIVIVEQTLVRMSRTKDHHDCNYSNPITTLTLFAMIALMSWLPADAQELHCLLPRWLLAIHYWFRSTEVLQKLWIIIVIPPHGVISHLFYSGANLAFPYPSMQWCATCLPLLLQTDVLIL